MSIKTVSLSLLFVIVALVAYLLLWPLGYELPEYSADHAPKMQGVLAPISTLDESIEVATGSGPEDIAFDDRGWVYTGLATGHIVRWKEGASNAEDWVNTQGRPLGMEFNSKGELIVADAIKGLLSIDAKGSITTLAANYDNRPFGFVDDLVIGPDDIVYFLDSSHRYSIEEDYVLNSFLDGRPLGRLLSYDPRTERVELIRDELYFPNGITLSHDSKAVLVSEMMTYRVLRVELEPGRKGESSVFSNNLPGFPNNISRTDRNSYQLALSAPRNAEVEALQVNPFIRKILLRLPEGMIPKSEPVKYGLVVELDQHGKVINSLHDPSGNHAFMLTSASEYKGRLYLGSIGDTAVKVLGF